MDMMPAALDLMRTVDAIASSMLEVSVVAVSPLSAYEFEHPNPCLEKVHRQC